MRYEKVINRIYDSRRLREAWHQVKKNAGAAGIDQMTVKDFDERKDELFPIIHEKLKQGTYRFRPVKRVWVRLFYDMPYNSYSLFIIFLILYRDYLITRR